MILGLGSGLFRCLELSIEFKYNNILLCSIGVECNIYYVYVTRATLMGTKNLYENGPNPFLGGVTKNMVRVNLMATFLFWHGFDNKSKLVYAGRYKMKMSNGNDHIFFKTRGWDTQEQTSWSSTVVVLPYYQ